MSRLHTTLWTAPWRLPLARPVVVAGADAPIAHRDGVLVRIHDEDSGQDTWGDACPLPGLSPDSLVDVVNAVEGEPNSELPASLSWAVRSAKPIDVLQQASTSTAILLDDAHAALPRLAPGATVKLKVGRRSLEEDLERVVEVACAVRAVGGVLRLDGNRRLDVPGATALAAAAGDVLAFFEEPVPAAHLRALPTWLPLALDEWLDELFAHGGLSRLPSAVAWVVKPTVLGAAVTQQLVEAAVRRNVTVVVSSAYESLVGRAALAAFAAEVDRAAGTSVVHGLGTGAAFAVDLELDEQRLLALPWKRWR